MRFRMIVGVALWCVLSVAGAAEQKLNLNTATKDQLMALGLSPSQALQVISHREKSGPFLQVDELMAVQQMNKQTFDKIRERVAVDE